MAAAASAMADRPARIRRASRDVSSAGRIGAECTQDRASRIHTTGYGKEGRHEANRQRSSPRR
jgi:hypothetical protein